MEEQLVINVDKFVLHSQSLRNFKGNISTTSKYKEFKRECMYKLQFKHDWSNAEVVFVEVEFIYPIPKKTSKRALNGVLGSFKSTRPDNSNLFKGLEDALSQKLQVDDAKFQINKIHKVYNTDENIKNLQIKLKIYT